MWVDSSTYLPVRETAAKGDGDGFPAVGHGDDEVHLAAAYRGEPGASGADAPAGLKRLK